MMFKLQTSALTRVFAVIIFIAGGWLVYVWGWPEYCWHFTTKPELLSTLDEVSGPPLESLRIIEPQPFEFEAMVDGVRVGSPVPLKTIDHRLEGDGFSLLVFENFPEIAPKTYFHLQIGPMAVSRAHIEAARTVLEREMAVIAVQRRANQFSASAGSAFDRAATVTGPHSTVLFCAGRSIITGVVMANDYSGRRDFMLRLNGLDRETAESIVSQLRFVGN